MVKTYSTSYTSFLDRDFAFGDQGASPLEPDRQGAGAEYLEPGKPERFSLRGGNPDGNRHGCTGAAHRSGRRKACFFARNDEYGEAARRNGGRGPRKVPAAFGQSPKVPRPVAEGRQLFGERALSAPAAAGVHARNDQMLTG